MATTRRWRDVLRRLASAAALSGGLTFAAPVPVPVPVSATRPVSSPQDTSPALPARDPADLLPRPTQVEAEPAVFLLGAHSTVIVDAGAPDAHPVATLLAHELRRVSGQDVPIQLGDAKDDDFGTWVVRLRPERTELGAEGYRLRIEPGQLRLVAATREGLTAGLQTLRQLLPATAPRPGEAPRELLLPCLRLEDAPRIPVRSLSLATHGSAPSKSTVLRLIGQLAQHKFNRLRLTGDTDRIDEATLDAWREAAARECVTLVVDDGR